MTDRSNPRWASIRYVGDPGLPVNVYDHRMLSDGFVAVDLKNRSVGCSKYLAYFVCF